MRYLFQNVLAIRSICFVWEHVLTYLVMTLADCTQQDVPDECVVTRGVPAHSTLLSGTTNSVFNPVSVNDDLHVNFRKTRYLGPARRR